MKLVHWVCGFVIFAFFVICALSFKSTELRIPVRYVLDTKDGYEVQVRGDATYLVAGGADSRCGSVVLIQALQRLASRLPKEILLAYGGESPILMREVEIEINRWLTSHLCRGVELKQASVRFSEPQARFGVFRPLPAGPR